MLKMKKTLTLLAAALLLAGSCNGPSSGEALLLDKDNIPEIVKAMTLEEKCHLVVGGQQKDVLDSTDQILMASTRKLVPGSAGTTYPVERLGIPAIVLADGPAGLRISPTRQNDTASYYCTGFPTGTLLASSWDPGMVEAVGRAMGEEVLEYGVDVLLAPGANLHRNPLCGRNFEYYSEDPLLSGTMAAAFINGVQSNGVGTSLKHFAVNNSEINRLACDSRVSVRALRELYLRNWEIALRQSAPWTIMTSYNYLNGVYTSEDPELLEGVLRGDWGYEGCIMTDWGGGQDPAAQIHAGNDMLQPGKDWQYKAIYEAVSNGSLPESELDACVSNILRLIVKTPRFRGYAYSNRPDLAAHAQLTREKAAEGFVLLKNENAALPLAEASSAALFGQASYRLSAGGTGSGNVNKAYVINLDEGLVNDGILLDGETDLAYREYTASEYARVDEANAGKKWYQIPEKAQEMPQASLEALAEKAAVNAETAIITIGRNSGEGTDRHLKDDFLLSGDELQLIKTVSAAFHAQDKNVTVVLNVAGVVETASWKDMVDAILLVWQPGQEAGNSIADALTGLVNPSGRLPMTFPESYADVPAQNFPALELNTGKNDSFLRFSKEKLYEVKDVDYIDYKEDIFMGYRHFCSHCENTSYPFGYGLSYTVFEIEDLRLKKNSEGWTVKVSVRNVGENPGRDVIQLYSFGNPANPQTCPSRELKGFAKTKVLNPGERQSVSIELNAMDLASYVEERSAWVLTPGIYAMAVTADSEDFGMSFGLEVKREREKATGDYLHPRGSVSDRLFIDK